MTKRSSDPGTDRWRLTFDAIRNALPPESLPSVSRLAEELVTPFQILISTMISLRTRDEVTLAASRRLFERASTPETIAELEEPEIAALIFPAGFYRTKARNIRLVARAVAQRYGGEVPPVREQLVALPGVGPKTANLVLGLGFEIPAICVDTHVHRVTNRAGWVRTSTPEDTEKALVELLPREFWIEINGLLVAFGQHICTPQSPWCSRCPIGPAADGPEGRLICRRVNVHASR